MTRMAAMRRYVAVVACACSLIPSLLLNQVHDRKNHDPHDVYEVPIQSGDFHGHRVRRTEFAAYGLDPQRQQPDHTHRHVRSMCPRQHVERRAEEIRGEPQTLVHEVTELPELTAQE